MPFRLTQSPMEVTPLPMTTDAREEHPKNAEEPMDVTESGMVTDAREEHPENADWPMDITESGMVTDTREEHPSNAEEPPCFKRPTARLTLGFEKPIFSHTSIERTLSLFFDSKYIVSRYISPDSCKCIYIHSFKSLNSLSF